MPQVAWVRCYSRRIGASMDNKLLIIGMGCGNPSYMLPIAKEKIKLAKTLVGAKRHLDSFKNLGQEKVYMEDGISKMLSYIEDNYKSEQIAVLVSGDTGYHSLLRYVKSNLSGIVLEVYPGVSSMSVMFARLSMMWDDATLVSAHGNDVDLVEIAKSNRKIGLLTDSKTTPKVIAQCLLDNGVINKKIAIGERLSYADEKVTVLSVEEATEYDSDKLCVVVIYDEEVCI